MDIEVLRSTLEQVNLAALGVGFLTGFVFSFNPVALAAIPVSLAYCHQGPRNPQCRGFRRPVHSWNDRHPRAARADGELGRTLGAKTLGTQVGLGFRPVIDPSWVTVARVA